MKKKLELNRETLRRLEPGMIGDVQGGIIQKKPIDSTPDAGCMTIWKCWTWNCGEMP